MTHRGSGLSSRSALNHVDVREVPVTIYGLAGDDGVVRYIGRSNKPTYRLSNHRGPTGAPEVRKWLTELDQRGESPRVIPLFVVEPGLDVAPFERAFIESYNRRNALLNVVGTGRRGACRDCGSREHQGGARNCRLRKGAA